MITKPTAIDGAYLIEPERQEDERGYFARTFCAEELGTLGLDVAVSQCSVSFNASPRTLRGLHYQAEPYGEAKLIRCTRGSAFDVLVDVRPHSPTYRAVVTQEIAGDGRLELFSPRGVAHGFLTLEPATEIYYQISAPYRPEAARGLRWDDPGADIPWPARPEIMSRRDATYPDRVW